MEQVYATLLLNETNEELNEENLTAVLEAAGCDVVESRTKALVAALEGVDVDRIGDAATGTGGTEVSDERDPAGSTDGEGNPPTGGEAIGSSDPDLLSTEADAEPSGGDGAPSDEEPTTVE